MVTVSEKQADISTCIDDIAGMLEGLSDWTDADANITNSGDTGNWRDNGRVFQNANMGIYVLFYYNNTGGNPVGIRFHLSNDWDSVNSHPAGKNNAHKYDPFRGEMGYDLRSTYNISSGVNWEHDGMFLNVGKGVDLGNNPGYSITYFLSASNSHIAGGVWNTTDSSQGGAGAMCLEFVDDKFWDDGEDPFAYWSLMLHDDGTKRSEGAYGFKHIAGQGNNNANLSRVYNIPGFTESNWGSINPDSNDDTFFYTKPIVYETHKQDIPVAYLDYPIRNDPSDGAAHGDTVSFNGNNYRCMKQSGSAFNTVVSCLVRYQ